jgi:hypothetical protein
MELAIEHFPVLARPMQFRQREKPCDVGLFDTEGRKQMGLF